MRAVVFALGILGAVAAASSGALAQDYAAEFDRQWGLRMIGADKALALGLDGRGVLVGVQDSGINATHYEFSGRVAPRSSNGLGGAAGFDWDNHGTHVAGIIAAGRNGSEMHGVAPGATLMSLQIGGSTLNEWTTRVRETLRFGVANNVRLFNASWGFTGAHSAIDFNTYRGLAQVEGFREVVDAGGVMVFANGNQGSNLALSMEAALPFYLPELERGWLAVASVGPTGNIAYYSQTCSVARLWCLAAPGGDSNIGGLDGEIYSTAAWGNHEYKQGTSMAAPHVTGALAVAKQLYPNASFQELRLLALHTATDIGAPGIDDIYGWGLLNLAAMIETDDPRAGTTYAQQSWTRQGVVNHIIDGLNPHASAARGGDWGWWAMPLGMSGSLGNTVSLGAAGITAGVEGSVAPDWYVKMFGAVSQSSITDNGNTANDTGYHLGGQILYESPSWFAEGTLGASVFSGVVQRGSAPGLGSTVIGRTGLAAGTSSTVDWAQWAALRFGYHLEIGTAGTVTPYLFGRVVNQNLSAFAETGSILGLSGAAATSLSTEVGLGLKWMGPALAAGPLEITPVLDMAYSWQDGGTTRNFNMLGNAMTADAGQLGGDTLQISASVEIGSQRSALDLKLGYTVQIQSGSVMHSAGLKLMGSF